MDQPLVQGLLAFLGGAAVSGLNALLSARLLNRKPSAYASFSAVRQLCSGSYRLPASSTRKDGRANCCDFNPRSREGSDRMRDPSRPAPYDFNPRSREGSDAWRDGNA